MPPDMFNTLCLLLTPFIYKPKSTSNTASWYWPRERITNWMQLVFTRTAFSLILSAFIQTELQGLTDYSTSIMTSALILQPRFTRPAPFYFQAPRHTHRQLVDPKDSLRQQMLPPWESVMNQTLNLEDAPTEVDADYSNDDLQLDENELPQKHCSSSNPYFSDSRCVNRYSGNNLNSIEIAEQQDNKIIELFKQRILKQLNLKEPPKITNTSWSSIPRVLQRHLRQIVEGNNHILEDPVEQNEEKETLVLLQQHPFQLGEIPSMTFTVKLVESIDERHILWARIHAETFEELPAGTEFNLWEIIPPSPRLQTQLGSAESWDKIADLSSNSDRRSTENFYTIFDEPRTPSFEDVPVVGEMVASAQLHADESDTFHSLTFNITSRLVHWIQRRNRMVRNGRSKINHKPLVKHLLLVCSECTEKRLGVDPKKVVMDIRYRAGLKRTRRAAGSSEEGLSNVCQESGHQFTCCTQPLSIKFADIGWDKWIVFPKQVEPNYCRGSCQATGFRSSHYDILNLLHQKNSTRFPGIKREDLQSCCYPTRRNSFSILYMTGENDIRMHVLHNLIVLGCGCS